MLKVQTLKSVIFPGTGDHPKEIILSDIKLGEGCYGKVFLGYGKVDPSKIYAIKCIERKKVVGDKAMKALKNEVAIMSDIQSQYVVAMKDGTKTTNNIYLSLELCNGGDRPNLDTSVAQKLFQNKLEVI